MTIVYFIIGLSVLVLLHEFGHFITAKLFNVYVYEFSLFMGPKLLQFKIGETKYSLRALPIGGYCSLAGEEDSQSKRNEEELEEEKLTKDDIERSVIENKTLDEIKKEKTKEIVKEEPVNVPLNRTLLGIKWWKKIIIMAAGGLSNIILCFVLLLVYFGNSIISRSNLEKNTIAYSTFQTETININDFTFKFYEKECGYYTEKSEAEAHLQGTVRSTAGIQTYEDFESIYEGGYSYMYERLEETYGLDYDLSKLNITTELYFSIDENKETYKIVDDIDLVLDNENKIVSHNSLTSYGFNNANAHYSFGKLLGKAFKTEGQFAIAIYKALPTLFTKEGVKNVTGVIGMYTMAKTTMDMGFFYYIYFLALISVNLGIMNLLPFPALDGGKILLTIIETITKKKTPKKVEGIINIVGFSVLIIIMVLVTIKDIVAPVV